MSSPPSSSSGGQHSESSAFGLYHEGVQRWIAKRRWRGLRPVQEQAARPILSATTDVMIAAATAGGKTEAAFFPILSHLAAGKGHSLCLCISPLKALINDQFDRLRDIGAAAGVPVWRWHGDVGRPHKQQFARAPTGVLVTTPESVEAMFVRRGPQVSGLLGDLAYVVVDELHAFVGSDRGKQLQSQLHRLDLVNRRRVPRVALSATFGDMDLAADYLRPGGSADVIRCEGGGEGGGDHQDLKLMLRGQRVAAPETSLLIERAERAEREDEVGHGLADQDADSHTRHLYRTLRGSNNLAFANSRRLVEQYADALRRMSVASAVPNEFLPHHGSLSKELRDEAERRLKCTSRPATLVATTTLEMGIDVGSVKSIAQLGCPPSVAAMRQRLGRSGRRDDQAAVLRIYISERGGLQDPSPQDLLRAQTVQAIAMVQLMLDGWVEPPVTQERHLSTLVHQLLSLITQHGGVRAAEAWSVLCDSGVFELGSKGEFTSLLRALAAAELLTQTGDGLLVLGVQGEKLVDHHEFYAAFFSPKEFQLVHEGRQLGSLPILRPVTVQSHLIFGGRRWEVVGVDGQAQVISVKPSPGGRPPQFDGGAAPVHDRVREQMRLVYLSDRLPRFADREARAFLQEGRAFFAQSRLAESMFVEHSKGCQLFPWVGDRVLDTLKVLFTSAGLSAENEGMSLRVGGTRAELSEVAHELLRQGLPTPANLARLVKYRDIGKYDHLLTEELRCLNYASSRFDLPGAEKVLRRCVDEHRSGQRLNRIPNAAEPSAGNPIR